jgi:putative sigma-54 modulation protein
LQFTISGKHVEITKAIKSYAQKKTAKFPRYYDSINRVEVIIEGNEGGNASVEVIASAEHSKLFIVKETGENTYACIDAAVRKLQRQLRRIKGKERDDKRADSV